MPRVAKGHVEQLPSGSWRARVYAGVDPITQREIRLKATAKTEQQAYIELGRLLKEANEGGELCGLQIRDIDLDRGLIHIAFNYVVRGGQRVRKDTKTYQDRWLAIDPDTCVLIATHLDEIRAPSWRCRRAGRCPGCPTSFPGALEPLSLRRG
jgi:integrase